MKILLVAPQDQTVLGTIAGYCRENLKAMGNEVLLFDFRERPYSSWGFIVGIKTMIRKIFPGWPALYDIPGIKTRVDNIINRMFLEQAVSFKPDLVLVLCGENIFPETIESLRKECDTTVIVNWLYDTMLLPSREELMRKVGQVYDYVFIIDSLEILKKIDIVFRHVQTLPVGCEPSIHRRMTLSSQELSFYGSDVAFVGTVTPEREKWLKQLLDFDLKIWGMWERESLCFKRCYQKKNVSAEETVKIYNASKIVLDIHQFLYRHHEIVNVSPRVFEVPASGGFLLTNACSQIGDLYRLGEEMVVYKDINDLKEILRYFLEHEQQRLAIIERGYEKARREYTYAKRLKELLESARKVR